MLVLVVAAAVVALAIIATVLAIAAVAMIVLVRCLVAGTVVAFVVVASIAAVMAVVAVMATVAMMIVTIVLIIRMSSMSITTRHLGTTFARFFCAHFLGGLLGFLLLELVEYAVCLIGVLALLKEANECNVIVRQSFMHLRILLLMLPRHRKEDLLDLLRLCGQLHRQTKEPFLKVAHDLHSTPHVIMH